MDGYQIDGLVLFSLKTGEISKQSYQQCASLVNGGRGSFLKPVSGAKLAPGMLEGILHPPGQAAFTSQATKLVQTASNGPRCRHPITSLSVNTHYKLHTAAKGNPHFSHETNL